MAKKAEETVNFDELVDGLGAGLGLKALHLQRGKYVKDSIPTGSLCLDMILGGGYAPGKVIVISGKEQSGKSTLTFFSLAWATSFGKIPAFHFDYEGAADPAYMNRIGVKTDFRKDIKDGKPIYYRYYQPDNGEQFFRFIRRVGLKLEDRESGLAQGLFFSDSVPAMLPESREEDDTKNPMALNARMFSESFPLVKSLLSKKRITAVLTNQIREKPGVSFGNPEYEPGGQAVQFYADQRLRVDSRSIPKHAPGNLKGPLAEEPCWDGNGIDRYRYVFARCTKNKVFSPFRQTWFRIWFEEGGQPGRGIDPVFDVYQYLLETGQIEKTKKGRSTAYRILLPGWEEEPFTWPEFKEIVLDPEKNKDKDWQLYGNCRKQIESGEAFTLYFNQVGKKNVEEAAPEEAEAAE